MASKALVITIKAIDQISAPIRRTMASIGKLGRRAIDTSARVLRGMSGLARKLTSMRTLLTGLAAALAGGAIVRHFIGISAAIDRTAKSARAMGIAVEDYSKLEFVADRAGISTQQLATAFRTAQRNVAQFVRGEGGQAARALADIDVSLVGANGHILEGTDLVRELLGALGKVPDEAVRTQKLVDIFGRVGAEMKNLGAGFEDVLADAERLGYITSAQARVAEAFQDSMANLRRGWLVFKANVLEAVGPVLEDMVNRSAESLSRFGKQVGDFLLTVRAAFGEGKVADQARRALLQIYDNVVDVGKVLIDSGARVLGVALFAAMDAATQGMGRLIGDNIAKELASGFKAAISPLELAVAKYGKVPGLRAMFNQVRSIADEMVRTAHGSGATIGDVAGTVAARVSDVMPAVNDEIVRMRDRLLEIAPKFDTTGELVRVVADAMRRLGIESQKTGDQTKDTGLKISQIWPAVVLGVEKAAEEARATREQFVQLGRSVFDTFGNQISGGLTAFATGAARAKDAFRDMAKGILDDLTRLTIRMAVFNALSAVFAPRQVQAGNLNNTPAGGFPSVGSGFDTAFARSGGLIQPGGRVERFARGGVVPGPNINRDIVPALLAPGEFVVNRRGVRNMGTESLHAINRGEGAGGGFTFNFAPVINMGGGGSSTSAREATEAMKAAFLKLFSTDPAFRDQVRARLT